MTLASSATDSRPVRRYLAPLGLENEVPIDFVLGSLVQGVLAAGSINGLSLDDITAEIQTATGLLVDRGEIERCIRSGILSGVSIADHDVPYAIISATSRSEVLERLERARSTEASVLTEWANDVLARPGCMPGMCAEWLVEDLPAFFDRVALYHGAETVALVYGHQG